MNPFSIHKEGRMIFIKVAGVLGLAISFCMAQTLSISGTVYDALNPGLTIPGATVTLKNTGLTATTALGGTFTITRTTDITCGNSKAISPATPVVLSAKGEIQLNLQEAARVMVKTYSVGGKQIGSMERTLTAGNHSIMPAKANSGIYLYQVIINGKAYALQQANVGGRAFAQKADVNGSTILSQGHAKSAASLAFSDSVIVSKQWFATQSVAVTDSVVSGLLFNLKGNEMDCPFITAGSGHTTYNLSNGYVVDQDEWDGSYNWSANPESLHVCTPQYVYWVIKMANTNTAVHSYPNIHKDYSNTPLSSFNSLTANFTTSSPHAPNMDYEAAFDVWINRYATELMIFCDNWHQAPAGSVIVNNATIDGHTYDIYMRGTNQTISYLAHTQYSSGTQNLKLFFNDMISRGWIASNSTLAQLDFGFEIVGTNNVRCTFVLSNFQINQN
jgi:hypothetical protein